NILRRYNVGNLVIDPVMVAKSGDKLLADEAHDALKKHLVSQATIVTPNIPEAEELTGVTVRTKEEMIEAGRQLLAMGCQSVLITGGHLEGESADDLYLTADEVHWFP